MVQSWSTAVAGVEVIPRNDPKVRRTTSALASRFTGDCVFMICQSFQGNGYQVVLIELVNLSQFESKWAKS